MKPSMGKSVAIPTVRAIMKRALLFAGAAFAPLIMVLALSTERDAPLLYLLLGYVAMMIVFAFRHSGLRHLRISRELDRAGLTTEGTVVDKLESRSRDRELHCDILYEYGEGYQAWQKVSEKVYESVCAGDKVTVRYLARDPKYSRLEFKPRDRLEG
jgi:hypothetical protein